MMYRVFSSGCMLRLMLILISSQNFAEVTQTWRDPTKPAMISVVAKDTTDDSKKMEASYRLKLIIISPTRRLALINETFVKVGDRIGEVNVQRITKNSVVLSAPGKKITLYLLDQKDWE